MSNETKHTSGLKTRHPCGSLAVERCYPPRYVTVPRTTVATEVVRRACPKCGSRWQAVVHPPVVRGDITTHRVEWVRLSAAIARAEGKP